MLETGKTELIHAVLEGVFYHLRWMLECQDKKLQTSNPIRFVGGGALSPVCCQMLADITGRTIETVKDTQYVGAAGAAGISGVGLGVIASLEKMKEFVPADQVYTPDEKAHEEYEPYYQTFKQIYKANKKIYNNLANPKEVKESDGSMLQAIKFALISASAGIVQAGSFAILESIFNMAWTPSYIISLALSVIWNFTFNRKITFKSSTNVPIAMAKVAVFYAIFTPVSTLLGNYLTGSLMWNDYIVTGLNMLMNMVLEFFYDKYFVFNDKNKKATEE